VSIRYIRIIRAILFLNYSFVLNFFTVDKKSIVFSTLEDETGDKLDEMFGLKPALVKMQPSRCLLPPKIIFYAQKIRDMPVYEDDIWTISFPRTGEYFKF